MDEALLGCLLRPLIYLVLLPVSWIVATPFILVFALFGYDSELENVASYYGKVTEMWGVGSAGL